MPKQLISTSKNFTSPVFDTYIPQITDPADIESAFKLFMYGQDGDGSSYDSTNSIYQHLLSIKNTADTNTTALNTHSSLTSGVHGVSGSLVGTTGAQTLSDKTFVNSTFSGTIEVTGNVISHVTVKNSSASNYNLTNTTGNNDDGTIIQMTSASVNTVTIPTNSSYNFIIGTQITIVQAGTGQTTIQAASGVTLNYTPGPKLRARWSAVTLFKTDTNTWIAIGDLSL